MEQSMFGFTKVLASNCMSDSSVIYSLFSNLGWWLNYSSYLVPQKVLSSNPGSENIIISCVTRLCWLISQSQFLFGTKKSLEFQTHSWAGERKHCCDLFHKVWLDVMSLITRPDLRSINSASVFKKKKKKLLMFNQNSFSQIWRNFTCPSIIITCRGNTWNSKCGRRRWWVKQRLQQMIFQAEEETSSDATKRRAS